MLVCHAARIPDYARVAVLTIAIVMLQGSLHSTLSPIVNAALRFVESLLGAGMAVIVVAVWPERKAVAS